MISRLRRWNDTLPYLVTGIILYALAIQLAGMWFFDDKLGYSIGLWYGAATSVAMALNMAKIIYDSVTFGANSRAQLIVKSVFRYIGVTVLLILIGYFKFGNLYMAMIGMFGLKVAAYLVPGMAKLRYKLTGKEESFIQSDQNSKNNETKEVTM